ncbi:hypothetical protein QMZ05_17520 [Bradyrhizobium sp. INPA03-11B]|uniref:hypothetical protein n=1 Tax=Bradyrhizobium sp. INPA03-11B TaxID=418598 RepID=UPI00338E8271
MTTQPGFARHVVATCKRLEGLPLAGETQAVLATVTGHPLTRRRGSVRCLPLSMNVSQELTMLVTYEEGGKVVTITGWRKWLIVAAVMVVVTVILTAVVALLFGIALTLAFVLLIAAPLVCALGLIAYAVRPMWRGTP